MTLPQFGQPIARIDINLADVLDVEITGPVAGQILIYDGDSWDNQTVTGDITITATGVVAIAAGVIVDADISATAEIAVSKLADGAARQVLQTDAGGTGVEWTNNVDLPGTLDVTGVATFDSNLVFGGAEVDLVSDTVFYISAVAEDQNLLLRGGPNALGGGGAVGLFGQSHGVVPGGLRLLTTNAAGNADVARLNLAGGAAVAVATWTLTTQAGLVLNNALDANTQDFNNVGAAGNFWTEFRIHLAGSNAGSLVLIDVENTDNTNLASHAELRMTTGGASGGDPRIAWGVNGVGLATWAMGVDNSGADRFALARSGTLGTNDAFRVTTATPPTVTYNTAHPTGTFDYVCDYCGRHEPEDFVCCGPVEWHDDVMDFRSLVLQKPGALAYMEKIGVMERTFDNDGQPEVFTVLGPDWMFAASMAYQNRRRLDSLYAELNERMELLEAA